MAAGGGAAGAAAAGEAEDTTATVGYSLEALSKELVPEMAKSASMKELFGVKRRVGGSKQVLSSLILQNPCPPVVSVPHTPPHHSTRKDGSEGSLVKIPELRDVQRAPATRLKWIGYSALDAKCVRRAGWMGVYMHMDPTIRQTTNSHGMAWTAAYSFLTTNNSMGMCTHPPTHSPPRSTWALREALEKKLRAIRWEREPLILCDKATQEADQVTMLDFYHRYFVPFGEVLTDMERAGAYVREVPML